MSLKSSASLLHIQSLQITVYISVIVANLLFGVLHPENILIAVGGMIFFAIALMRNLRAGNPVKTC